ncbi:MAG: zinc-dependent metalloprotease family protein [Enhygromyxa sp.]
MRRVACLPIVFLCLSACGSDDPGATDAGLSGNEDTSSGDGDGDGGDGDGDTFTPIPARGITITGVTANHGVNVSIASGDQWVDGTGREARLVTGRDTLIRVYHELDPDWVEREIEARLELTVGGETHSFTTRKVIVTDTVDTYLDGGLWFALPAENGFTEPDASFQVSLWEVEPGGEQLPEHVNVSPASGPELIGFESIPMEMNVYFVPFQWNGRTPDVGNEMKMGIIENEIYQTEPIEALNTTIGQLQTSGGSSNVCNMLQTMQQIWSSHGAPGNVYYVGLIDTGAASGIMGCAWLNSNVNADVWVDSNIGTTATSIVHEIGHNMGLAHVDCDDMGNPAAGPDPSYPDHPLGRTLNTGFGIRDFRLYPGDTTIDYMSYCNKRWVSPWTWNKVWPRIQSFTAMGSPFVVEPEPVLQFGMYPDGSESWWTALARLDPERAPDNAHIEFVRDGKIIERVPAQVDTLSDDASVWVTVRMPGGDPQAQFDLVRYVGPDGIREARRGEVSFYTDLIPQ